MVDAETISILFGPSQVGKSTLVNALLDCDYAKVGDGSGQSVTETPYYVEDTAIGSVLDGPGYNDSLGRFSSEEASRRYRAALVSHPFHSVQVLLLESAASPTAQLSTSLQKLQGTFGRAVLVLGVNFIQSELH